MKRSTRGKDAINALVKDELAAVETYRQALEKIGDDPSAEELRRIENDHERAVTLLQEEVAEMGEEPAISSGAWGAWARAVEGAAKLFGDRAAIRALKDGEEHGARDYERALEDQTLDEKVKMLILTSLLPRAREHIGVLDRFLAGGATSRGGMSYNADQGYGASGEGRGVA